MTLDNLLQECAKDTYNTKVMVRSGTYSGKGLEYVNRFISGINRGISKICREKYAPLAVENITTDEDCEFSITDLLQTPLRIREVRVDHDKYQFEIDPAGAVYVESLPNTLVTVLYDYLPAPMTYADLDVEIPLPQYAVDHRIIGFYADYDFLSQEGTSYDTARAEAWINLFNDGFSNINSPMTQRRVKMV
jgi:hypothetical protein